MAGPDRIHRQGQIRGSGGRLGRPARRHHRAATRQIRDEGRKSHQERREVRSGVMTRHSVWVRATHWINFLSFLALAVSGIAILLAHPRFYWGETGYFDTPAAFELPLRVNLDQTGWGRSLHFLAAWIAVVNGFIYVAWGLLTGHFRQNFLPARPANPVGYNLVQRFAYLTVVFGLLPLV